MKNFMPIFVIALFVSTSALGARFTPMFGVITAVPSEARFILSAMQNKQSKEIGRVHYVQGKISHKSVVLVIGGAGIINAAVATTLLIKNYNPKYIVFSGTAGSIAADANVGDVVLVNKAYLIDLGDQSKLVPEFPDFGNNPMTRHKDKAVYGSDERLTVAALKFSKGLSLTAYNHLGETTLAKISESSIATTSHFPDTDADIEKMKKMHIPVVAMETASMLKVCWLFHKNCFAVRGISDVLRVGNKPNKYTDWNARNAKFAADNAGKMVVSLISKFVN